MPDEKDPGASGPFAAHEVLDRAYMATEIFDGFVATHPFVTAHPELKEKAEKLSEALGEFYQLAGKYALDDPTP